MKVKHIRKATAVENEIVIVLHDSHASPPPKKVLAILERYGTTSAGRLKAWWGRAAADQQRNEVFFRGRGDLRDPNVAIVRIDAPAASGPWRDVGRRIGALCKQLRLSTATLHLEALKATKESITAMLEELALSGYEYTSYRSQKSDRPKMESVTLVGGVAGDSGQAGTYADAVSFARDLVNMPPCDCTPEYLATTAEAVARQQRLACRVFDRKDLKRMGANALLAVGQGSALPPYLIHLSYKPTKKSSERIALVGKGVTFDSGGLCIKTRSGMAHMKSDMSGAAAVLAVMRNIRRLAPRTEVDMYVPTVENMLGDRAFRPGDVVRSLSGKTIEILNTDAEGRLILADALTYAVQQGATSIVDVATLTGACAAALGDGYAGLFCNSDALSARLLRCAESTDEPVWRLPLVAKYGKYIRSDIADMKNTGTDRGGGAITAALLLQEFVGTSRWAHLDIAGTAWADDDAFFGVRGATGFGARLLCEFVRTS